MKILIRSTNWVGDAVMSIPALRAARQRWPADEIAILARPWVADLYREQGLADRLIHFEHLGRHRGYLGLERLAAELRAERFDVALLLQNAFQAAWLVAQAGIPERIGYAREWRGWLLTRAISAPRPGEIPGYEAHYYLELLRRAGWIDGLPAVEPILLQISEDSRKRAQSILESAGARPTAPRIAIAPGAAFGAARCWPAARYAAFADRVIAEFGADVILFGAAGEQAAFARIAAAMKARPVNLAGQTAIGDLPALLAACRLFVGNDSGAMHVAAAAGIPVVGIFGPSDPEGTAPVAPLFTLVRERVSCSPCFLRRCPVDHRCMERIEVDRVFQAARAHLDARSQHLV